MKRKVTLKRIKELDPIEGLVAEGLFYEKTNDIDEAAKTYNKLFHNLLSTFNKVDGFFFRLFKRTVKKFSL